MLVKQGRADEVMLRGSEGSGDAPQWPLLSFTRTHTHRRWDRNLCPVIRRILAIVDILLES